MTAVSHEMSDEPQIEIQRADSTSWNQPFSFATKNIPGQQ